MAKTPLTDAERQQRRRDKIKAQGLRPIKTQLHKPESDKLDQLLVARNGYCGEPMSVDDYLALLIEQDWQRLQQQLAELPKACGFCGKALPEGCGRQSKGLGDCFHTRQARAFRFDVTHHGAHHGSE